MSYFVNVPTPITLHATITFDLDELRAALGLTPSHASAVEESLIPRGPLATPWGSIDNDFSNRRQCFLMYDERQQFRNSWIQVASSKQLRAGWRSAIRWWYPRTRRQGYARDEGFGHWSEAFEQLGYLRCVAPLYTPDGSDFRLEASYRDGFPEDVWASFQRQIDAIVQDPGAPWLYPMAMPN